MKRLAAAALALCFLLSFGCGVAVAKKKRLVDFAVDGQGRAVALLQLAKDTKPLLARFTAEGALDTTFSGDGVLRPPLFGFGAHFALEESGDLILGGRLAGAPPGRSVILYRYRSDGRRDRSFGPPGRVRLPYGELARLFVQPSGHVLALPVSVCPERACGYLYRLVKVVRLTPSGRRAGLGSGNGEQWQLLAAAMNPRGGLLVVGEAVDLQYVDFQRFAPDADYRGFLREDIGLPPEEEWQEEFVPAITDLAFMADWKFAETPFFGPEIWLRNSDGSPDLSFGDSGRAACGYEPEPGKYRGFFASPPFSSVAVTADQKLVAAGGYGPCGLVRFLADGSLDPSFAGGGAVNVEAAGMPRPTALALLPDGGALVAGWDTAAKALRVARYSPDGALVPTYGSGGIATLAVGAPG